MTDKDFYFDDLRLASYFESSWLDKVRQLGVADQLDSTGHPIPENFITCDFQSLAANLIFQSLDKEKLRPRSYLEIGPALGRTCYEVLTKMPSIEKATMVEPSKIALQIFQKLLMKGGVNEFPYIKGIGEWGCLKIDSTPLVDSLKHVTFEFINDRLSRRTFAHGRTFDLVTCLNVVDQCASPKELMSAAQEMTATGGILAVSCAYQWQKEKMASPLLLSRTESPTDKIPSLSLSVTTRVSSRFSNDLKSTLMKSDIT